MSSSLFFNGSVELLDSASGVRQAFIDLAGNLTVLPEEGDLKVSDGPRKIRLAASQANLEVTFVGITTGKLLLLKTNKNLTIKRNSSGGEAWPVGRWKSTTPGGILIGPTSFTSLFLTNLEAAEAEVDLLVAGV
mgnify:CR=1 FL=1